MRIQETKTWKELEDIDKIGVYEVMTARLIDKIGMFSEYLIYFFKIRNIKKELKEKK